MDADRKWTAMMRVGQTQKNLVNTQPTGNSWPHVKQELRWVCSSKLRASVLPPLAREMTFLACRAHKRASGWCDLSGRRSAASYNWVCHELIEERLTWLRTCYDISFQDLACCRSRATQVQAPLPQSYGRAVDAKSDKKFISRSIICSTIIPWKFGKTRETV